jgi:hypothetical protein
VTVLAFTNDILGTRRQFIVPTGSSERPLNPAAVGVPAVAELRRSRHCRLRVHSSAGPYERVTGVVSDMLAST